ARTWPRATAAILAPPLLALSAPVAMLSGLLQKLPVFGMRGPSARTRSFGGWTSGREEDDAAGMMDRVLAMAEKTVKQVMVPRSEIVSISIGDDREKILWRLRESGLTRLPLCRDDIDSVIGYVNAKDVLRAAPGSPASKDILRLKRDIRFVPETQRLDRLLKEMQSRREHMVMAVDEFGNVSGLVTLEDLLSEMVGGIRDEGDDSPPRIEAAGPGLWRMDGTVLISELSREIGISLPGDPHMTVAGCLLERMGRLAVPGDSAVLGTFRLKVLEVQGRRIVRMELSADEPAGRSVP
ncbi:MAG: hemolysin family protein, partial [Planctomycetota bacterium]|nr:hemolysin family protein [Planctomycetota bacterium]